MSLSCAYNNVLYCLSTHLLNFKKYKINCCQKKDKICKWKYRLSENDNWADTFIYNIQTDTPQCRRASLLSMISVTLHKNKQHIYHNIR